MRKKRTERKKLKRNSERIKKNKKTNINNSRIVNSSGLAKGSDGNLLSITVICHLTYWDWKDAGEVYRPVFCHVNNVLLDRDFLVWWMEIVYCHTIAVQQLQHIVTKKQKMLHFPEQYFLPFIINCGVLLYLSHFATLLSGDSDAICWSKTVLYHLAEHQMES